jgi:hypothetical protein
MDFTPELIIDQDKRAALLGHIDEFLTSLQQPEFANYAGRITNEALAALINHITCIPTEMGLSGAPWDGCRRRLEEIQYALHTPPAECISEESCYMACHRSLMTSLQNCRLYIGNANAQ